MMRGLNAKSGCRSWWTMARTLETSGFKVVNSVLCNDICNDKWYNQVIFQQNDIEVIWNKKSTNTSYDLYYHDLYLLYPIIKNNQSILNNIKFKYGQSNNKTHKINNINFTHTENSNDALLDMISCVLEGKVDYDYNKEISLFCNLIIDKKK